MLHITKRDRIEKFLTDIKKPVAEDIYTEDVYKKLAELNPETCSELDFKNIFGHTAHIDLKCTECYKYVNQVVRLGEEPDWESSTVWICKNCLEKALELIKNSTTKKL